MIRYALLLATAALFFTACGDDDCGATRDVAAQSVCTSADLAENQPLRVDVETVPLEGNDALACTAEVEGSDVFLSVTREDSCEGEDPVGPRSRVVTCELPPVVFGNYAVRVNGEPAGVLAVTQESTETSCAFR